MMGSSAGTSASAPRGERAPVDSAVAASTDDRAAAAWLWRVSGGSKAAVLVLLFVQVALGAVSVSYALALRGIVDRAVAADSGGFVAAAAVLVGLMAAQILLGAVQRWLSERTRSVIENRCKERLFATLLAKDYAQVSATHSGEWMNRLTSDTVVVANGIVDIIPSVGGMVTRIVGAIAALLVMEPFFGWVLVPCGIAVIVLTWAFRKVLKRLHKRIQEADGRLRVFLQEHLENLLVVRSFAREERTGAEASERMDGHREARMRRMRFSNVCNIGFATLMQGAYVFAAVYCGWSILVGAMTYGTFIAVLQLVNQVQSPFANISGYLPRWYAMTASAERIMAAEAFADDRDAAAVPDEEVRRFYREDFRALGLRDVAFAYAAVDSVVERDAAADAGDAGLAHGGSGDAESAAESTAACAPAGRRVLNRFSLELAKGDCMALMGPSGRGKSTVIKLLMRLYAPDEGCCYLRGSQGEQELTASWRGLFAYVPQGSQLMSGAIRSCVAFGDARLMHDDEAIMQALDVACAGSFVRELPDGIDTELGERGSGLSEGQLQRIAIARAVFSGHPVLLLDESTSSLDADTERELLGNLQRMTDRTVLLVTHRESVLAICNKRITLDELR